MAAPGQCGCQGFWAHAARRSQHTKNSELHRGSLRSRHASATRRVQQTVRPDLFHPERAFIATGFHGERQILPLGAINASDLNQGNAGRHRLAIYLNDPRSGLLFGFGEAALRHAPFIFAG